MKDICHDIRPSPRLVCKPLQSKGCPTNNKSPNAMKIIIDNLAFPYDSGLRILKAKYADCPMRELERIWDSIPEISFAYIVREFKDVERRRIAYTYLGLERMLKQLEPVSISRETVRKTTRWVEADGSFTERLYEDTYELSRVGWRQLYEGIDPHKASGVPHSRFQDRYIVKCSDTSTGKGYALWVDIRDVYRTNSTGNGAEPEESMSQERLESMVTPIQAIAWTIMTDLAPRDILAILRQGDCVLFRKRPRCKRLPEERHLTEWEYRTLLREES